MTPATKLYAVTRSDLPIGAQAAQAMHAAIELAMSPSPQVKNWHKNSNTVVIVTVENRKRLLGVYEDAYFADYPRVEFREPDLNNEITAVAFIAPDGYLVRGMPLLGET